MAKTSLAYNKSNGKAARRSLKDFIFYCQIGTFCKRCKTYKKKPSSKVVKGNTFGVGHNLTLFIDKSCSEIQ